MSDIYRSTNQLGFRLEKRNNQWVVIEQTSYGKDYSPRPATVLEVLAWFQLKAALKE